MHSLQSFSGSEWDQIRFSQSKLFFISFWGRVNRNVLDARRNKQYLIERSIFRRALAERETRDARWGRNGIEWTGALACVSSRVPRVKRVTRGRRKKKEKERKKKRRKNRGGETRERYGRFCKSRHAGEARSHYRCVSNHFLMAKRHLAQRRHRACEIQMFQRLKRLTRLRRVRPGRIMSVLSRMLMRAGTCIWHRSINPSNGESAPFDSDRSTRADRAIANVRERRRYVRRDNYSNFNDEIARGGTRLGEKISQCVRIMRVSRSDRKPIVYRR